MLSVGVVHVGAATEYYLASVAQGVEDYYLGDGEAPGAWYGTSAAAQGLTGQVDEASFRAIAAGLDPTTGDARAKRPGTVAFYDLTFSAPKSVSALWAAGGAYVGNQVQDAHEEALRAALDWLESTAAYTRRGAGGIHQEQLPGLTIATFRHRTSRAGDPQLHTHALVANVEQRQDGNYGRIDGRHLYAAARTAGFLYQTHLRHLLTERLHVRWGEVTNGIAEIEGVPKDLCDAWSTRRKEIEALLAERGELTPRSAQIAALDSRRAKDAAPRIEGMPATADASAYDVVPGRLHEQWREQAEAFGFDADAVRQVIARPAAHRSPSERSLAEKILGERGLTAQASTFTRHDVLRAVASEHRAGLSVEAARAYTARLLNRDEVIPLATMPHVDSSITRGEVIRRADGTVSAVPKARYTTAELASREQRLVNLALERQNAGRAQAPEMVVEQLIARRPTIGDDQAAMVRRITTSGAGIDLVVGLAGAGKTYAMDTAREIFEASGYRVVGAALAARAAKQLSEDAHIPATTLASLENRLERNEPVFDANTVLVIDEAAMVGTRTYDRILHAADAAGAKVVLVGDPHQLSEIDSGGTYRAFLARFDTVSELTENRRQEQPWQVEALNQLRNGDPLAALRSFDEHGGIHRGRRADDVRTAMVDDWYQAQENGQTALMMAGENKGVAQLNRLARTKLIAEGHLGAPLTTLAKGGGEVREWETLVVRRNDHDLDLQNGTLVQVHPTQAGDGLHVETLDGRHLRITDEGTLASLEYGYASTVHRAQGATVDVGLVYATDKLFRQLAYVALSRGRLDNRLYATSRQVERITERAGKQAETPVEAWEQATRRDRSKRHALDEALTEPVARPVEAAPPPPEIEPPGLELGR